MKSFLIIGMGTFGHHLCRALAEQKCEVMIVDRRGEVLEDMLPLAVSAKIGDCTNEDVLRSFDVGSFDACFVCLGDDVLASLEVTSLLNGADEIIYPELEVATSIAVSESSDSIFDCIRLSADYSIYELEPLERWLGKSLKDLNFRAKYDLTVIAAVKGETIRPNLGPNYVFRAEEHLLVLGRIEDIRKVIR